MRRAAAGAAPDRPPSPPRWTREFLVYLEPVGPLSAAQFAAYAALLRTHAAALPISALTRPGGYAAELSPFRSFSWRGNGVLRFRFVAAGDARAESCDGADVHAWHRPVAVLGLCHCPATPSLRDALAQFAAAARRFPGALVHKCFAFEPQLGDRELEQLAALGRLVVFPAHHALDAGGSTVSLHLQVVMDTLAVTVLMSLESTIRAAMRPQAALELGDGGAASFLLDTAIEPSRAQTQTQTPPPPQSLHAAISSLASTAVSSTASALAAPFADARGRKRQAARHRKLFGDYSVLLQCVPDALEHYAAALELLREEERRSSGAPGDVLWLAAALDGLAYCLSLEARGQFAVEVLERASEAVALYARVGVAGLECQLVANAGWYCVAVAAQLARAAAGGGGGAKEKTIEVAWAKRVLWELIERGLAVFPDLDAHQQLEFVVDASRMLESVGHRRRMALFLHEAAALLLARHAGPAGRGGSGAQSPGPPSTQRLKDLQAALLLERLAAARLGVSDDLRANDSGGRAWEVTTLYRSTKTRRGVAVDVSASKVAAQGGGDDAWLVLRFHVVRQLLTIAKRLGDPFLVGTYGIQLLQLLPRCDALASPATRPPPAKAGGGGSRKAASVEQVQKPFTALRVAAQGAAGERQGLFSKTSVYFSPPPSIEGKAKRYFSLAASSSATMSSAAASLSSTIASTPRMLATPRQQFSAAVSAISTKASPAFASFAHHSSPHGFGSSGSSGSPSVAGLEDVGSPGFGGNSNSSHDSKFERGPSSGSSVGSAASQGGAGTPTPGAPDRRFEPPPPPVWNLRSKEDIVRLERSVLSVLEAECAALRASEQVKLPAFLGVDSVRVRTAREHPFVSKAAALAKYAQRADDSGAAPSLGSDATPDFFYSPFDKPTRAGRHGGDSDTVGSGATESPDSVFPVYEKIELEVVVSNPFGVPVEVQQATAWVVYEDECDSDSSATPAAVECYPCSLALAPYETHKSVVLGVQPLREGAFRVRGCFLKVLNLKTSFELATSVSFRVVGRLPLASLSLCETGSLGRAPTSSSERREHVRISMFSSETKRGELRIRNVGQNAITRCRLAATVRRQHATKATVVIFDNLSSPSTALSSTPDGNVDSRLVSVVETDSTTLRCTPLLLLHENHSESGSGPKLPMEHGDSVAIQFEVLLQKRGSSLQHASDDAPVEEEEEIVWSFVYADDPDAASPAAASSTAAVYYRETTLALQLVSLPSLRLSGVSLVPSTPERIPCVSSSTSSRALVLQREPLSFSAGLDNAHFVLVVEVANPTETAFRFRMRRAHSRALVVADNDDGDAKVDTDSDDDSDDKSCCDVEIGRKCTRRLAIELPRLHPRSPLLRAHAGGAGEFAKSAEAPTRRPLASLLNALVAMEWETHFGTKGSLRFEDHLWSRDAAATHVATLLSPELAFEVAVSEQFASGDPGGRALVSTATATDDDDDDDESAIPMLHGGAATDRAPSVSRSPFVFFHGAQLTGERRQLAVRVLEFVPIAIEIRRLWRSGSDDVSQTSIAIRITQDGDDDDGDGDGDSADDASRVDADESVVVVGMLQCDLAWPSERNDESADRATADRRSQLRHEIQVLFLSRGVFRVSVCGRVLDTARNAVREIWCHEPLYIRASE
ncbi:hypothetical protein PybrP1_008224 [[Pythium] brassicae (nom. inval.)]|nr:hypothetical protein PybrP1_008224 [[Pythium] brassicae (nom. inval.)]